MTDLRIADAPELTAAEINDSLKVPTGGFGNYSITMITIMDWLLNYKMFATQSYVNGQVGAVTTTLNNHTSRIDNPHQVTKTQVGLGNVDNTSDINKPISSATQTALTNLNTSLTGAISVKANSVDVYTKSEVYTKVESDGKYHQKLSIDGILAPTAVFDDVKNLDGVNGTPDLIINQPIQNLTNRTEFLKTHNNLVGRDVNNAHPSSSILDSSGKDQQQINDEQEVINDKLKKIGYANFRDIREFGATQDKTTDYTALILSTISSLGEGAQLYIPYGVKWAATSNPDAVYAAMPDNATIIDDSGYEDRYSTKYWQASTQIYYDTKDYGSAGRANGNGLNIRANYNGYLNFEMDGAFGTNDCKATVLWRMNNGTADAIQIAGDGVDSTKAHLAFATYGAYSNGTTALKMGLQSSISPHSFAFNSDLVQDTSYVFGKRLPRTLQGTPEDTPTWQAASHSTRWAQPTSHTGSFFQFWFIGSSQKFRQEIAQDGKFELINANSVRFTIKTDGGINNRKSVITPTTSTTLLNTDSASYVSNVLATGGYTITLPKAALGLSFEISVDTANNLRVSPNVADNFVGLVAGKYKESSTIGSKLKVTAITANIWSFEQIGTWVNQP